MIHNHYSTTISYHRSVIIHSYLVTCKSKPRNSHHNHSLPISMFGSHHWPNESKKKIMPWHRASSGAKYGLQIWMYTAMRYLTPKFQMNSKFQVVGWSLYLVTYILRLYRRMGRKTPKRPNMDVIFEVKTPSRRLLCHPPEPPVGGPTRWSKWIRLKDPLK